MVLLFTATLAYILLLAHFSITLLYVFPLNPIKAALDRPLVAYMGQVFAQDWSLFAPDPQHTNLGVLVQCRNRNGRASKWFDLEAAFLDGVHQYPFGAYVRLVRMPTNALRTYMGSGIDPDTLAALTRKCKGERLSCFRHNSAATASFARGKRELQGLASATCQALLPGGTSAVRIIGTASRLKPWSKRKSKVWQPVTVTIASTPWMPYRPVASIPFRLESGQ